ncbi:conserved hypothetical protein [Theileria equi strain WA]|uniref:Uncharacterized protein n=1 Tax=Theileria equi strain WA TaxID=1537102 RepID=L1LCK4_THEEQ|nr:conserved hypothetical protein [Theileria equi strain WA]EKX72888.1 conserved hypothetical protein [Theileria equi strain WA]|eukprot:XP_004832340.1 conserved hypothetical protein [Theileria equi strain WA]
MSEVDVNGDSVSSSGSLPFTREDLEFLKGIKVEEGKSCLVCFEDLSKDNMVGYKVDIYSIWSISTFCIDCVQRLLKIQYYKYLETLSKTTCAREQRTLLDKGPPINISDRIGFPLSGSQEVFCLFDFNTFKPLSAKLDGSLTGQARQDLWDELNKFRFKNDNEE